MLCVYGTPCAREIEEEVRWGGEGEDREGRGVHCEGSRKRATRKKQKSSRTMTGAAGGEEPTFIARRTASLLSGYHALCVGAYLLARRNLNRSRAGS